jgi:hypothetical protein
MSFGRELSMDRDQPKGPASKLYASGDRYKFPRPS